MKLGFRIAINIIILAGLVYLQREFYPKVETTIEYVTQTDSTKLLEIEQLREDNRRLIEELMERPISPVKYVRIPIYRDTCLVDTIRVTDTIKIEKIVPKTEFVIRDTCFKEQPLIYSAEDFILYKKYKKHKIRFNTDYFINGDTIEILSGEMDEIKLGTFTNKYDFPKKLKTNKTFFVHVKGNSLNKDIENRLYNIIM